MKKYILAHDLGTSGNKATLFDLDGNLINSTVYSYELITGKGNTAEQKADDWWKAVCETSKLLALTVDKKDIAAVSFSGQMMGCLCVDKNGNPLHNALIWADMRSEKQAEQISDRIDPHSFYNITGHRISASYSLTKLMWIRDNLPGVYKNTYKMLNAKDYIILKLTGKFVTEPSDASSTCLLDLNTLNWSDDIIRISGLDKEKLPDIIRSADIAGGITEEAAKLTGLCAGTPVVCGGGDGCCAAVGTGVVKEGRANCCLGTSSWISMAAKTPIKDKEMAVFNFAHTVPGYIMPCGTMQTGGGALSWAVNNAFFKSGKNTEDNKNMIYGTVNKEVGLSPVGANNLLFLPYLIGERSPRWNPKAKGSFIGLTVNHTRGDMLRAVMEGVGYNLDIILNIFKNNGNKIDELTLTGGGARNSVWAEILCDIFALPVSVPERLKEATSMGAAITAAVGIGALKSFDEADRFLAVNSRITPNNDNSVKYDKMKILFDEAYQALEPLFEKM